MRLAMRRSPSSCFALGNRSINFASPEYFHSSAALHCGQCYLRVFDIEKQPGQHRPRDSSLTAGKINPSHTNAQRLIVPADGTVDRFRNQGALEAKDGQTGSQIDLDDPTLPLI